MEVVETGTSVNGNDEENKKNHLNQLPTDVMLEVLFYFTGRELAVLFSVSRFMRVLSRDNRLWNVHYTNKFLMNNSNPCPPTLDRTFDAYRQRFMCPEIGDKVEVAWKGKFRLETQDIYQGMAWWLAEVVDRHTEQDRYKIRYPGWESRWDEWVPRSRLRWVVGLKGVGAEIHSKDVVEIWCCGANVPGAWLESKVKKVRGKKYCVGKVLSTGHMWVEQDRLRLVKKAADVAKRSAARRSWDATIGAAASNSSSINDHETETRPSGFLSTFTFLPSRLVKWVRRSIFSGSNTRSSRRGIDRGLSTLATASTGSQESSNVTNNDYMDDISDAGSSDVDSIIDDDDGVDNLVTVQSDEEILAEVSSVNGEDPDVEDYGSQNDDDTLDDLESPPLSLVTAPTEFH